MRKLGLLFVMILSLFMGVNTAIAVIGTPHLDIEVNQWESNWVMTPTVTCGEGDSLFSLFRPSVDMQIRMGMPPMTENFDNLAMPHLILGGQGEYYLGFVVTPEGQDRWDGWLVVTDHDGVSWAWGQVPPVVPGSCISVREAVVDNRLWVAYQIMEDKGETLQASVWRLWAEWAPGAIEFHEPCLVDQYTCYEEVPDIRNIFAIASPPVIAAGDTLVGLSWRRSDLRGNQIVYGMTFDSQTGEEVDPPQRVSHVGFSVDGVFPDWANSPSITATEDGQFVIAWLQGPKNESEPPAVYWSILGQFPNQRKISTHDRMTGPPVVGQWGGYMMCFWEQGNPDDLRSHRIWGIADTSPLGGISHPVQVSDEGQVGPSRRPELAILNYGTSEKDGAHIQLDVAIITFSDPRIWGYEEKGQAGDLWGSIVALDLFVMASAAERGAGSDPPVGKPDFCIANSHDWDLGHGSTIAYLPFQGGRPILDVKCQGWNTGTGRSTIFNFASEPENYVRLHVKIDPEKDGVYEDSTVVDLWGLGQDRPLVLEDANYVLRAEVSEGGDVKWSDVVELHLPVDVEEDRNPELPTAFFVTQNYPNPFNPITEIKYALPADCQVRLEIYNLLGQRVRMLVDEHQGAGYRSAHWDASAFSSDIYFYRLQAGDFVETRKMILLR